MMAGERPDELVDVYSRSLGEHDLAVGRRDAYVRFVSESRHQRAHPACPLWAISKPVRPGSAIGNLTTTQIASTLDREGFAVNNITFIASTAALALVAACAPMLTAASGACHATLRGEFVPDDSPKQRFQAAPQKLLFFSLDEIVEEDGRTVEKNFQSSTLSNTKMTFPIPFVLNIDSPKHCPRELQLNVHGSDHAGFHHEFPMRGRKKSASRKLNLRL